VPFPPRMTSVGGHRTQKGNAAPAATWGTCAPSRIPAQGGERPRENMSASTSETASPSTARAAGGRREGQALWQGVATLTAVAVAILLAVPSALAHLRAAALLLHFAD